MSNEGLGLFLCRHLGWDSKTEKVYFGGAGSKGDIGMNLDQLPDWQKTEILSDPFSVINKTNPKDMIIIFDDVGMGGMADNLRKQGWRVVGGSEFTDKLENDRTLGTKLASKVMKVPETFPFTSFDEGIKFLKSQDKDTRFVFKPDDSGVPKEYTRVGKNIPDLVDALNLYKTNWGWEESFQLQKFIKGIEVDFNAYFNGKEYLDDSFIVYFENKPLMNDDVGPATGGAIAVEFSRPMEGKLFEILQKFVPVWQKAGYVGQVSINSIVSEEDHEPYFLEWTTRFGYPSFPMEISLIEDSGAHITKLINAMANGENSKIFPRDKIAVVVAVNSGLPGTSAEQTKEQLTVKWDSKWEKYFFPYTIHYDPKKKSLVLARGSRTFVLNVTCVADNLDGAKEMLYETYLPTLQLDGKSWRTDLGVDAKKRIQKLREWEIL